MATNEQTLPEAFVGQMSELLGPELPDFLAALSTPAPVSIRTNPLKPGLATAELEQIPWCDRGYYLPERRTFTLDPLFHAGGYYVQEASSMLIGEALRQLIPNDRPVRALDLCAAPGGKSTLLASLLPEDSLLLCNEVIRARYQILRENLIKWGSSITHGAQHDSEHLQTLGGFFDFVLVDAPCSGEGLFRKDPAAVAEWSPDHVRLCAARQKRILANAAHLVRPGGILCYSTCTYNSLENTDNARWLTANFDLEPQPLELNFQWGVQAQPIGYQCYPHRVAGEGLYLSCFRRTDGPSPSWSGIRPDKHFTPLPGRLQASIIHWLQPGLEVDLFQNDRNEVFAFPSAQTEVLLWLRKQLPRVDLGLWMGTLKGKDFVPSPDLALHAWCAEDIPRLDLSLEQSLRFLKKENIHPGHALTGWALACFQGRPMGWLKGLRNRANNYYPKAWRIRMKID